jgi:hypothetical protein
MKYTIFRFSVIFGRNSYLKIGYFMVWEAFSRGFDVRGRIKIPLISHFGKKFLKK